MTRKNQKNSLGGGPKNFIDQIKQTMLSVIDWFDDWRDLRARQREFTEIQRENREETLREVEKEKIAVPGQKKPENRPKAAVRTKPKRKRKGRMTERTKRIIFIDSILALVLLLIVVLVIFAGKKLMDGKEASKAVKGDVKSQASGNDTGKGETKSQPAAAGNTISLTISAAGDFTLGTDEAFDYGTSLNAKFEEVNDPAWFLSNVKDIFAADDFTIVNFEGDLTTSTDRQEKQFAFKGDAAFAKILTAGSVEAGNLANNHSYDYGEQGYTDTIAALDAEKIVNFGDDRTALAEVKGIKIGLLGINELATGLDGKTKCTEQIQSLKNQGAQLVIATFHWGNELDEVPDSIQTEMGRAAIDAGADLVLAHHPHVLQGIENYKGKNIVYSLGNFCFGGNTNPTDMDTMIFQQTFTFTDGVLAGDNVTNIIPCSVSSDSGYNNYQPTPAQGEEASRILQKIEERTAGIPLANGQ